MFFCEVTKKLSKPGEKCRKIVVEKREKTYSKRFRDMETGKIQTVECSKGWEIVKEISATEAGEKLWMAAHTIDLAT